MATRTKPKKNRFLRLIGFTLAYLGLFLVLTLACSRRLNDFLVAYEANQPSIVLDAYVNSFDEEHIARLCEPYLDTLDARFTQRDQAYAALRARFEGELSYKKDYRQSDSSVSTYYLFNGDQELGSFQLKTTDSVCYFPWMEKVPGLSIASRYFSLSSCEIANEDFSFSVALDGYSMIVGSDCTVLVNGTELTDEFLTRENITTSLATVFSGYTGFPTRKEYTVTGCYGDPDIQVKLPSGETIAYSSIDPEENEMFFTLNCSSAQQADLQAFSEEFVDVYIKFTSNYRRTPDANLAELLKYLDNTELANKFRLSSDAMAFTKSYDDTVTEVSIVPVQLSEHLYFVRCDYTLDTMNKAQKHILTNNSLSLILSDEAGSLKVKDMLVGGRTTVEDEE